MVGTILLYNESPEELNNIVNFLNNHSLYPASTTTIENVRSILSFMEYSWVVLDGSAQSILMGRQLKRETPEKRVIIFSTMDLLPADKRLGILLAKDLEELVKLIRAD